MFKEWFENKYLEWRGDRFGHDASVRAFARWLGISQQMADSYLKGLYIPQSKQNIDKLVRRFGPETYEALGMERTDRDEIIYLLDKIPPELYPRLIQELKARYLVLKPGSSDRQ